MSDDKLTLAQVEQTYGQLPTGKEFFYDWYGANTAIFKFVNSIHSPNYDQFMLFATQLGNRHFFLPYLMVLAVFVVVSTLYRKISGKGGVKQYFVMWIGICAVMVVSFAVYGLLSMWLKEYFQFARPYVLIEGVTLLELRDRTDAYHSLPSGHVSFISFMIFSMWPALSKNMKWFGVAVIALVAWSRMALGVHFPADTFWGFMLGMAIAFCVRSMVYTVLRKIFGLNCGSF